MRVRTALSVIGAVLAVVAPLAYAVSIVRGVSRPQRSTRLILAAVMSLNFLVLATSGDVNSFEMAFATVMFVQGLVLFGLSMWRGIGGFARLDRICIALAAAGVFVWRMSDSALVGVFAAVVVDVVAYIPAFVKTWKHPETEGSGFYVVSLLAFTLGLARFEWGPALVFQVYVIVCSVLMLVCINRRAVHRFVNARQT